MGITIYARQAFLDSAAKLGSFNLFTLGEAVQITQNLLFEKFAQVFIYNLVLLRYAPFELPAQLAEFLLRHSIEALCGALPVKLLYCALQIRYAEFRGPI